MRRTFLKQSAALTLSAMLSPAAMSQAAASFPSKPIKLIVPFPPGGGVDIAGRVAAAMLSEELKQATVVENRTGATGAIGYEAVARAPADGYTLLVGSATPLTVLPLTTDTLPYKLSDYAPISMIATVPHVLVIPAQLPPKNLKEFIEYARKASPPLVWGSPGPGTVHFMAGEFFYAATGAKGLQVPYRGSGQMMPDLLAGRVQAASMEISAAYPHISAGTLRALAIASTERSPMLPDLATMEEQGFKGFTVTSWFGMLAPRGTPPAIVDTLAKAMQKRSGEERFTKALSDLGATPMTSTPAQFSEFVRSETDKWARLIKPEAARTGS